MFYHHLLLFAKKVFIFLWLCLVAFAVFILIYHPAFCSKEQIVRLLEAFESYLLPAYLLICTLRGMLLLPSTPFVLAGAVLFPERLFLVCLISMAGILLSAALIYHFSRFAGFDAFFKKKYAGQIEKLQSKINHPYGVLFVIVWSFVPLVPTDIICYVAGTVKMDFKKFILAVFVGELPLVLLCVFFGANLALVF